MTFATSNFPLYHLSVALFITFSYPLVYGLFRRLRDIMYTFKIVISPVLFPEGTREQFVCEMFGVCGRRITWKNLGTT